MWRNGTQAENQHECARLAQHCIDMRSGTSAHSSTTDAIRHRWAGFLGHCHEHNACKSDAGAAVVLAVLSTHTTMKSTSCASQHMMEITPVLWQGSRRCLAHTVLSASLASTGPGVQRESSSHTGDPAARDQQKRMMT